MAVKQLERQKSDELTMVPADLFWRLSVEQYHTMIEKGFLTEDDPVELLEGWLIQKMPKDARHSTITRLIRKYLANLLTSDWYVDSQEPITTFDSEPEPDVFVVRGTELDYLHQHPSPKDIAILIEVANTTLASDRTLKKRLYAAARVHEYWIANLRDNQVEVYTEPFGEGVSAEYGQQRTYRASDQIPVTIDEQLLGHITVSDILPE